MGLGSIRRPSYVIHYEEQGWWARSLALPLGRSSLGAQESAWSRVEASIKGRPTDPSCESDTLLIMKKLWWTMPNHGLVRASQRSDFHCDADFYTAKPRTNGDDYEGLMHQPDTYSTKLVDGLKTWSRHLTTVADCQELVWQLCGWVALSSKSSLMLRI